MVVCFFFFNDTATTEIYTLSLHDALPISGAPCRPSNPTRRPRRPRFRGRSGCRGSDAGASSWTHPHGSEGDTPELQSWRLVARRQPRAKTQGYVQMDENVYIPRDKVLSLVTAIA